MTFELALEFVFAHTETSLFEDDEFAAVVADVDTLSRGQALDLAAPDIIIRCRRCRRQHGRGRESGFRGRAPVHEPAEIVNTNPASSRAVKAV